MPLADKLFVLCILFGSIHTLLHRTHWTRMGPKAAATSSETFNLAKALDQTDVPKITDFDRKVYEACLKIPAGKVSTYKEIAKAIGSDRAFRAVGSSLRRNPFAPMVPCHRVVASDLSLGGFFGSTDPAGEMLRKKVSMLQAEGVVLDCDAVKAKAKAKGRVMEETLSAKATTGAGRKRKAAAVEGDGAVSNSGTTKNMKVTPANVYAF